MRASRQHKGSAALLRGAVIAALLGSWLPAAAAHAADTPEQRAAGLVSQMTPAERVDLVASGDQGVPRLGIPPVSGIDGPNGVGTASAGVTAFPNEVNIGASWDPALAFRFGAALGDETRAKGHTLLFAPTLNIVRTPLWGRAAETYSEDPFLTSSLVASEVRGIQSARVMAEPKHYAGNNQEIGRIGTPLATPGVDDRVSRRTLEEIYFPGFRSAVREGGAASVMCSYNRINGTQSCQNPLTLGILKGWGLRGFVEPDAILAVRDTAAGANAGVDNFQIGSPSGLKAAVAAGTVPQSRIDDAARRILTGMIRVGILDAPAPVAQPEASSAAHRDLAATISAQASVLLQNRRGVLPLGRGDRSIAVIGYDAGQGTQIEEGGSAAVKPGAPIVTPLAGIRVRAPHGTDVTYAQGTRGVVSLPVVPASVLTPSSGSGQGLTASFYAPHVPDFSGTPVATRVDPTIDAKNVLAPGAGSARWTGTVTAPATGEYRFSLTVAGNARLFIGDKLVVSGDTEWINLNQGAPDQTFHGLVHLTAGQKVPIRLEYATDASILGAELHLGWQPPEPGLRAQAVEAARKADVAVVFANDVTGEGMDRPSLSLPGDQDRLIEAVAKANRRTVVVLHTASAVLMPWHDKVAAIVEAWYPGQQSGDAIAKTLFGDVDPSGRLPVTFPASESQGPLAGHPERYPGIANVAEYGERLLVGYRFFDAKAQRPLFPFGYGLSYTSWSLGRPKLTRDGDGYDVTVKVRNTGRRAGAQVVQLYVRAPAAAGEPPRQLKAFRKVFLGPHRSTKVRLALTRSSLQVFDETSNAFRAVPGEYRIYVGTSSRDLPRSTSVELR
jgi:beta-glucosidase